MNISFTDKTDNITVEALESLFASVKWKSAKYSDQLLQAINGSHSVVTAWDGEKLVGLINALSDGALTAYFHYMLIDPNYQDLGIGKKLIDIMLDRYKDYPAKVLIAYPEVTEFYKKCGFQQEEGMVPLYISELI